MPTGIVRVKSICEKCPNLNGWGKPEKLVCILKTEEVKRHHTMSIVELQDKLHDGCPYELEHFMGEKQ